MTTHLSNLPQYHCYVTHASGSHLLFVIYILLYMAISHVTYQLAELLIQGFQFAQSCKTSSGTCGRCLSCIMVYAESLLMRSYYFSFAVIAFSGTSKNINTWNYMLVRIHVILITRDRSAKSMKQSHPLAIHLVDSMPQESGENAAHPWSCKLGKYSGKNNARDFWNFCKVPVATWLKESDLFPCERTINSYV